MLNLKEINKTDPVKRNVDHGLDNMQGTTPFDPPEAYDEGRKSSIPEDQMPEIIRQLMEEHVIATKQLDDFEKALIDYKTSNFVLSPEINIAFSEFFKYYDNHLMLHNEKEDKVLFPFLETKLMESGEHSVGENPTTAIDVMEDDHVKIIQLGTLAFNFFGLATRLKDPESRMFTCDSGYNSGREMIELLRLHIYREDYTLFPLAFKLISKEEFEAMVPKANKFKAIASTR